MTARDVIGSEYTLSLLVMPNQVNSLGVLHGGHMLSWMDMAAWVVATRAVVPDQVVLFKAADGVEWSGPVRAGDVCEVRARLVGIGRSSLRVELRATAEDPTRKMTREVCRAVFTMVAVDDAGGSTPVRLA